MQPPRLRKVTVRTLHTHLKDRRFAVPKLQRNFVWDPGRAAKLMDSIYHQMPIGSLFLWEMDGQSANLIRQSADVLPPFNPNHKHIWFVIDGQQRLSVIHQAFTADIRENDSGREINFGRLCFVVHPNPQLENPPRIVYRKPIDGEFVPLRDILSPDWKSRMARKSKGFLNKIKKCRNRLLSYPVPLVTLQSATLDEIGEVFIRVNSQGMRITSADRAIALMGNLDVRSMAHELRQYIREEVFNISGIDPILMGFNLIAESPQDDGAPPKLEIMARRWSKLIQTDESHKDNFRQIWHKYQNSFRASVDFLHNHFPVHDESYLPSVNMLATLAVFFFYHPAPPNQQQSREIRKWFWTTGIAQRYSGKGYHRNIVADAKFFEALAQGKRKSFVFRDLLDPVVDIQGSEYSSRSARTRTFFCLLASRRPQYLDNGDAIPLMNNAIHHANLKHRHHIFPRGQLKNHFSSHVYNSLCNICFLVAHDNNKIGGKLPGNYLSNYRDNGWQLFSQVMRSHLIPIEKDSGIWDKGIVQAFKQFRKTRLALICKELEREAGIKLFQEN